MPNRRILIAGAAGGIGSFLSRSFPLDICMLLYHSKIPAMTDNGHPVRADLTQFDKVQEAVESLLSVWGRIDVVINASGITRDGFAHKLEPGMWQRVIDVNLTGSFNLIRAVLPSMRSKGYGRIILMSSVVCQAPVMGTAPYSASKAGLSGLVRTVAMENAIKGVTCNSIALGYMDSGMIKQIPETELDRIKEKIPMRRFGRSDEVLNAVNFLIDTEYVTGQTIAVNGGLYAG